MTAMIEAVVIILCLLASSASVCACRHHVESSRAGTTSSCHQHEGDPPTHEAEVYDQGGSSISECGCACFDRSPQVYAKFGDLKITKVSAATPVETAKIKHVLEIAAVPETVVERPFYLSDSFYNFSPGRAPPTL